MQSPTFARKTSGRGLLPGRSCTCPTHHDRVSLERKDFPWVTRPQRFSMIVETAPHVSFHRPLALGGACGATAGLTGSVGCTFGVRRGIHQDGVRPKRLRHGAVRFCLGTSWRRLCDYRGRAGSAGFSTSGLSAGANGVCASAVPKNTASNTLLPDSRGSLRGWSCATHLASPL